MIWWDSAKFRPDTKLIPSWFVGGRDSDAAIIFMDDLASRLANRVQLTSDGHKAYLEAVEGAFGADIDYAMLVKMYGESSESEKRYSPAVWSIDLEISPKRAVPRGFQCGGAKPLRARSGEAPSRRHGSHVLGARGPSIYFGDRGPSHDCPAAGRSRSVKRTYRSRYT
jgi:hypothetical protein